MARRRTGGGPRAQNEIDFTPAEVLDASLADEAQRRYLNYALSVITSRALPDVRDGLKPVQRRILYAMWAVMRLRSDVKYRKSATVVGEVMGKLHPHGDTAIYDALVRLAQDWVMALPLVDGRGNFGSPDGDAPAAMRYTEARLRAVAAELMSELGARTVDFRPNYDGQHSEPVVLPARFPHLLVNGSQGIAVGMATSIPPHDLGEVVTAAIALIDDPELTVKQLLKHVKGPDFPTGGQLIATREELARVYESGQGTWKLRGEWKLEAPAAGRANPQLVITSIPYGLERRAVVEKIAEVVVSRKLPPLLDVRDESTVDTRVVCEVKKDADPQLVMAYLFKHTPLQTTVAVNLTCLVPSESAPVEADAMPDPEAEADGQGEGVYRPVAVATPRRLSLKQMLDHFLDFRMEVVTRRTRHELAELRKRIHVLEGFVIVFDALDEVIRIVRRSDGRQDAKEKLMQRFALSEVQTEAILELRLYRLAKLEILVIREELAAKQKEAKAKERLLRSEDARWKLVRAELEEVRAAYPTTRRAAIVAEVREPEFEAEDFIVDEDVMVVVTQQGWVKRQQRVRDAQSTRVREGDAVLGVVAGSTRASVAFFSSFGSCYVARFVDVPATTGYGVPVQTLFKLADGERIVRVLGFDARFLEVPPPLEGEDVGGPFALAVTKQGLAMQFSLRAHREPSNRSGRRYMRVGDGDEVVLVDLVEEGDRVACVTEQGRALVCEESEITLLSGPGKGVMLIKLAKGDAVLGAAVLRSDSDALVVARESGVELTVTARKYAPTSRAGKGFELVKRGRLERVVAAPPVVPAFPEEAS